MTKHKAKKARVERRGWEEDEKALAVTTMGYNDAPELTSRMTRHSFIQEITAMLYAYGDVRHPLPETVALVEEIVHDQMCELLKACAGIAAARSSPSIGLEEFVFLLRKNRPKLSRFVKRMTFLDNHAKLVAASSSAEGFTEDILGDESKVQKRSKTCTDFLSFIDESGDLSRAATELVGDKIKVKRMERAEQQTRNMDSEEYMEYVKCRQVSLAPAKGKKKFRDWIDLDFLDIDITPTVYGWEALEYLAQETVSELVDFALLVRSESVPPLLPCEAEPDARHMPVYASSSFIDRAEILGSSSSEVKEETTGEGVPLGKKTKGESVKLNRKLALTTSHVREAMRRFEKRDTKTFLSRTLAVSNAEMAPKLLCLL